jgi:cyclopropane fatty-acyl-phospholipid synthase-like methyltransferase
VLRAHIPQSGCALEIASGTGQHCALFAKYFPELVWWPSDPSAEARQSINGWADEMGLFNLKAPLDLDVTQEGWQKAFDVPFDVILAINLIHISAWAATEGLMHGAGELLAEGGMLYLYGPYRRDGDHTAASNVKFDAWLKGQNVTWGVKDMDEVSQQGEKNGLKLAHILEMPANNFSLIFQKT